jgi:hypothetical protein
MHLDNAIAFIAETQLVTPSADGEMSRCLVHCQYGVSRSASVVLGFLMINFGLSLDAALVLVRAKRSQVDPNLGFLAQLLEREAQLEMSGEIATTVIRSLFPPGDTAASSITLATKLTTIPNGTSVLDTANDLWEQTSYCFPVLGLNGAVLGFLDTPDILAWFRGGHDPNISAADAATWLKRNRIEYSVVVPDKTSIWTLVELLAGTALRAVLWNAETQSIAGLVSRSDLLEMLLEQVKSQDSEHALLHEALCATYVQVYRDLSSTTVSEHCTLRSAVGMLAARDSTRVSISS